MSLQKIQQNLSLIKKNQHDFDTFLKHIKTRQNIRELSKWKQQSKNKDNTEEGISKILPSLRQETNPEDNDRMYKSQRLSQSHVGDLKSTDRNIKQQISSKIAIKNLDKINTNSSLIFQEQKVKKDHLKNQNQIIELRSGNQLPSWLFEHIRKKNVNKLKNFNFHEIDHHKHNQTQNNNNFISNNCEQNSKQRYLNSTNANFQQSSKSNNYFEEKESFSKARSSFEIRPANHSMDFKEIKKKYNEKNKGEANQEINFSDYSYNYCSENEFKQTEKKMREGKSSSSALSYEKKREHKLRQKQRRQEKQQQWNEPQKRKYKQKEHFEHKRIEVGNKKVLINFLINRQPTIQQQDPLIQPKKGHAY